MLGTQSGVNELKVHDVTTPPQYPGLSGSPWADDVTTPNLTGQVTALII